MGAAEPHVALLRGINVGGKHRLAMSDLRAYFEKAGALGTLTHIQSGNVVFTTGRRNAALVCEAVTSSIREHQGFEVPIVCHSAAVLRSVVERCPFADCENVHVVFLSAKPANTAVATLAKDRSPGDTFVVVDDVMYLHLPNGMARTKLTNAWIDAQLKVTSTARNWRTVTTLLGMCSA